MANRGGRRFPYMPPRMQIPLIPFPPWSPDGNFHGSLPRPHGVRNGFNFSPMRFPVKRLNHPPAFQNGLINNNNNNNNNNKTQGKAQKKRHKEKHKGKNKEKKQSIPGVQFKDCSPITINVALEADTTITIKNSKTVIELKKDDELKKELDDELKKELDDELKKDDVHNSKKQETVIEIVEKIQALKSDPGEAHSSKKREIIDVESDSDDDKHKDKRPCTLEAPNSGNKTEDIPAKYILHLTSAIQNYFADNVQTPALFKKKVDLRDGMQSLIREQSGMDGVLHMTGSSMSGFGSLTSDVDMALVFDPNVNGIGKAQSRKAITRIAGSLRRQGFCRDVEMVFAKVPIVKFYDSISRCEVDININNTLGIKNSFLLRAISLVDPRIPPLVVTIKCWAKSHNINCAYDGSLSSYCLVNMIIYFLQTGVSPPVLPPLRQYVDRLQNVDVNRQLQEFVPKDFIKFENRNKEPVGQLFVTFFKFWVKKFRQNKIYSVYNAKERIRSYNEPELDRTAYHLIMEEPFQKDNIARALRANNFKDIKNLFQTMLNEFKEVAAFEELFKRGILLHQPSNNVTRLDLD